MSEQPQGRGDDYCLDDLIQFINHPPQTLSPPVTPVQVYPLTCTDVEVRSDGRHHTSKANTAPPRRGSALPGYSMRGIKQLGKPRTAGRRTPRLDAASATVLEEWMLHHQGMTRLVALPPHIASYSDSLCPRCAANPFPTPSQKMELAKTTGMSFHQVRDCPSLPDGLCLRSYAPSLKQVGTWMTNNRKRRLYPITSGRRKPKTSFDHRILAQHNRHASIKTFQCYSPAHPGQRPAAAESAFKLPDADYDGLQVMLSSPDSTGMQPGDSEDTEQGSGAGWYCNGAFGAGNCQDMQFYENDSLSNADGNFSGGIM